MQLVRLFVWLVLFSWHVFFLSKATVTCSRQYHTNETDREALLMIKSEIEQDPSKVLDSWNSSLHFCRWRGVKCGNNNKQQRVVSLELPLLHLAGTLSPYIGNLTFLKVLDLGDNNFRGTIPPQICSTPRLQHVELSNNSFQGTLPTNLTNLSKLEILYIFTNNLTGQVPAELASLPRLRELGLYANHFTGTIPPSLGNLSFLTVLSLGRNNIEGGIPAEIGRLQNLGFLQLAENNLAGTLPPQIYNISSLFYLAVPSNSLHGQLPPRLGLDLPRLESILVGGNHFSGSIPESLANASRLTQLSIEFNNFNNPPPLNLGTLKNLQLLQMNGNPIFSRCKSNCHLGFFSSLINCTKLTTLVLDQTNLTGVFPDVVTNLSTTLIYLILKQNSLSGQVPQGIGNLFNVVKFSLRENKLSGVIPDSIGRLTKLQGLSMSANQFSGKIPASVGNLSLLAALGLYDNMLEGEIPTSLGDCKLLQSIDLSSNNLTGKIPGQVLSLPSLSIGLFLDRNRLAGPLPLEVGTLRNIQQLTMQGNQLSGAIPSTLGSCEILEHLDMGGNRFEGNIPPSFQQLRGLQYLNLSQNSLFGRIPEFLGDLSYLSYLDLSYNDFDGQVPEKGVFANASDFFFSGNKGLCGGTHQLQLPPCPTPSKQKKRIATPAIVLSVTGGVACVLLLAFVYWRRKQRRQEVPPCGLPEVDQYSDLSYRDLQLATGDFSSDNLLGKGSFGSVYKGTLSTGELTAIKVFDLNVRGAHRSFLAECQALKRIRHRNLVKIVSCCSSIDFKGQEFKALVYEFMPNGNLDGWLHPDPSVGPENPYSLTLVQRLNIAIDVANALEYLHHHSQEPVAHCDLKPSNVLLDIDLIAHIGDFGLARLVIDTSTTSPQSESTSNVIRGTIGYVAPEYGTTKEVSTLGDAYSYGILLLELFTGKRPTDGTLSEGVTLHGFVEIALVNDHVMKIIDPRLMVNEQASKETEYSSGIVSKGGGSSSSSSNNYSMKVCLARILKIGLMCSVDPPRERMDIKDALKELEKAKKMLQQHLV